MPFERQQAPQRIPSRSSARAALGSVVGVMAFLALSAGSPAAHARDDAGEAESRKETGLATYYAKRFEGRRTASGQTFRHSELLAAHASHPFGTLVRVTNLRNGSSVDVKIADRGGFAKRSGELIIDLSLSAASRLDMISGGRARVMVEVLGRGERKAKALIEAPETAIAATTIRSVAAATPILSASAVD
jgi:rare lipoprotein A